jgi:3-phosphoshikimate 1-carboxyvinyltransferase
VSSTAQPGGGASSGERSFVALPADRVGGELSVPGDKSISHRALMLGGIASGRTVIRGFLHSEDCVATWHALEALGVPIREDADGVVHVTGVGPDGLCAASGPLDLGNSGTAIRLMTGLLAGQPFASELTGDASLRQRPMERVAEPLRAMGARIATEAGKAPIRIEGGTRLRGVDYSQPVASAQIKSALLLAALSATGRTTVRSPGPSRDHTERMLSGMGAELEIDEARSVSLDGPQSLRGIELDVPGDLSSAAFFIVAACLGAERGLLLRNVGVNPTRTGLLTILEAMGADIELRNLRTAGTEPVADLKVNKSDLRGIEVPPELVPLAIDEFPILFIAAAGAQGATTVRGADELRHKESDRLAVMAAGLASLGGRVEEETAGLVIQGGRLRGGAVDSHGDHRIAMSFAVASLISDEAIEIRDTAPVATSFPGFTEVAAAAGLRVEER